ncbi:MAG: CidA/LrgA family protein [Eubacteriales bacterium]|nr:CidA/LrgA family protein [Eubacteriales bacterium]
MKIVKQIGLIFSIYLGSEIISKLLPFSLPGSVISLVVIAVLLATNRMKEEDIRETADFLLKIMAMLFVPAGIGVVEDFSSVQGQLWKIIFIVIAALIITFLGSYLVASLVQKIAERRKRKYGNHME